MVSIFPESGILKIWQDYLPGMPNLLTDDGESVHVIYPGRINDDLGADIRDAVIATSRGVLKGDVEIHVKSSNWYNHHHDQDPSYNRVILHVVFWHDTRTPINLQNGLKVPTLELYKYVESQTNHFTEFGYPYMIRTMPCRRAIYNWDDVFVGKILDAAGQERFWAKANDFQNKLSLIGSGQSLYRGIMAALGYTKNKHPMMELACRMSLIQLEEAVSGLTSDYECLVQYQALLMGMAGLLPSQRSKKYIASRQDDAWVEKLEEAWTLSGEEATMSDNDWHIFKVRPCNHPTRRIAAMSYMLLRYREEGMLFGLMNRLGMSLPNSDCRGLEQSLLVAAGGYWGKNLDFGLPIRGSVPALLGRGRTADIVINVLLPFATAWGYQSSRPDFGRKIFELYCHYPALATNTLESHMMHQLGISRYLVNSAQRQQGLIHIYNTFCSQGKCHSCPLGEDVD
jgi:hypothetical protein